MVGATHILFILWWWGSLAGAADPFAGTWSLNLSRSKLPPPLPKSQIVTAVIDGNSVQLTEELVTASGEHMTISVKAAFDGRDYPITGSPFADTAAYQRPDIRTIHGVGKKGGKVVMRETVAVSPDGRTLTGTYSGTDATGKEVSAVAVLTGSKNRGKSRTLLRKQGLHPPILGVGIGIGIEACSPLPKSIAIPTPNIFMRQWVRPGAHEGLLRK